MRSIDTARAYADENMTQEAVHAYEAALKEISLPVKERLEAANFIFFSGEDYKIAYDEYLSLYNKGHYQKEIKELLWQAFYEPNIDEQIEIYSRNIESLKEYPYIFKKKFPDFEKNIILFFPYDDNGFIPYDSRTNKFGEYINFNDPVIDQYFFKDLEKPVLASDVYSQYQLEYLNDNVRESSWVAKENHVYLHYTSWNKFCAHLQCIDFTKLLQSEKFVILFEDEISQYPIDFKKRFGIDYTQYPVKPIGINEITKMIWHMQLSSNNGGDFFNEIFYGHPNLLTIESLMIDNIEDLITEGLPMVRRGEHGAKWLEPLFEMDNPTEKDLIVSLFLNNEICVPNIDPAARIVPALLFQPHFYKMEFELSYDPRFQGLVLNSAQDKAIHRLPVFNQFKYIKLFAPMRRPTTSYASLIRNSQLQILEDTTFKISVKDELARRIVDVGCYVDKEDRFYRDGILVRFEDGKLNPKATFTALAEFLDIPYTESMTYCSDQNGKDPLTYKTNARGFDASTVYNTYDEYVDDADRCLIEYFFRDAYEKYHYDFHYYNGEAADDAWFKKMSENSVKINSLIQNSYERALTKNAEEQHVPLNNLDQITDEYICKIKENRVDLCRILNKKVPRLSSWGRPLKPLPLLKLPTNLLQREIYH